MHIHINSVHISNLKRTLVDKTYFLFNTSSISAEREKPYNKKLILLTIFNLKRKQKLPSKSPETDKRIIKKVSHVLSMTILGSCIKHGCL